MHLPKIRQPFPLLVKELTEVAARPRTYAARVGFAAVLVAVLAFRLWSVARFGRGDLFNLLGSGKGLFAWLLGCQLGAILLFLPVSMAGAVAGEKERDSLALLFITGLRPYEILLQKYVAGLVPMLTMLLISLPLLALAYALGGFSPGDLCAGGYILFLTCLQVGAIALMLSAFSTTTAGALIGTYAFILVFYFAMFALGMSMRYTGGFGLSSPLRRLSWMLLPPLVPAWLGLGSFDDVVLASLPALASVVVFLLAARVFLKRRAFLPPRNLLLTFWRYLDGYLNCGRVVFREPDTLPGRDPVAWREVHRKALGKPRYLIRIFLLLEVPVLLAATDFITSETKFMFSTQSRELSGMVFGLWLIMVLALGVQAANTIAVERVRQTLDVLAATPLSGPAIIRQKMRGVWRLAWVFVVPLVTVFLFEAWWETGGHPWRKTDQWGLLLYLSSSLACLAVHVSAFVWVALWVSLRSRNRTRAVLTVLVVLIAWNLLPILAYSLSAPPPPPTRRLGEPNSLEDIAVLFVAFSPAAMVAVTETGELPGLGRRGALSGRDMNVALGPLVAVTVLGHGLILLWFRRRCLRHADRYLGRMAASAARWQAARG